VTDLSKQAHRGAAGLAHVLQGRRGLRHGLIFLLDAISTVLSLYLAFLLRFEGSIPPEWFRKMLLVMPGLVLLRLALNLAFGVHRWSFRMSGLYEALRIALSTLSGSALLVTTFYFLREYGPPRSVVALEFFFTTSAMAILRFSPRLASAWYVDQRRSRRGLRRRTLIAGAGSAGDLLLRDLIRSTEHPYEVVGFVDDDPQKKGLRIAGKPVLGPIDRLPEFVAKHEVTQVLIAIPRVSAERIRSILGVCSSLKLQFKIIPVSFAYLNDKIAASMLHDLSPEDLLPRVQASFDRSEITPRLEGRRVLVTGAAGSIGGEIARQVATHALSSLVLADINENELYFLYRELKEKHPSLDLHAEIVDIRESVRLEWLGQNYRPHCVFHAAAHKHVPLMEDAPGEAVKNNIFGTLHVARMADRCGAERFVLISTDKAVHPSSVMGATKRVAEFVVRAVARHSRTRYTSVRFGNVLGSSGSVVPIFRRQIETGGPVTVTHPDCTRYFMTIPEAVGLVLLAGLLDYGELCILDMGEAIRIVDLAQHMITMAGLVPGVDIRIEFTGLRAGEKLTEDLMTDDEERSQVARDKILVAKAPPPPQDLWERLTELSELVGRNDRSSILRALKHLIPTFQVPVPPKTEAPRPVEVGAVSWGPYRAGREVPSSER
jgi:FlaA1/EpsC-like NDP-sugar epimerase